MGTMSEPTARGPRPGGRSASCLILVLLGIDLLLIVGLAVLVWRTAVLEDRLASQHRFDPTDYTQPPVVPRADLTDAEQSTIELFRSAAPSVVFITSVDVRTDPFRRNIMEIPRGTGSGFVWDGNGHVVTNFHVIRGANAFRVTLADQSVWPAQPVGSSPNRDLAVLRLQAPADRLRAIPIGTSSDLLVGQHVLAIGNPIGLDHTLSTGGISGLGREIQAITGRPISGVIQTDAAINPGNSGGPLLDTSGRLIGINTAIYSPSGASAGIGFAVPVDTVSRIVPQLILHGREIRPLLGAEIAEPDVMRQLGVAGALILKVQPGSPVATAGLQPTRIDMATGAIVLGDIIVGMDGEPVNEPNDLFRVLDERRPGQRITLTILRGETRLEVPITLGASS